MSAAGRTGYLVAPPGGGGPGVLLLHSWWGATPFFRRFADRLAAEGFVVLLPDLSGGAQPPDEAEAEALLAAMEPNEVADLVVSSAATLCSLELTPDGPVGVVGFSMGASWALWLASRQPALVGAVAAFYGNQSVGYEHATAAFQLHVGDDDSFVSADDLALLEATLLLDGHDVEVHRYAAVGHWFMEEDRPGHHQPEAAGLAWDRLVDFLRRQLAGGSDTMRT